MRYTSTRDASKSYTFEEALCSGYAPDGGLYVPESLPQVDASKLKHWATLSYVDLATEVLGLFIAPEEISTEDLASLCQSALKGFPAAAVVPVVKVGNVYVAELFHGPTFCFKDLGLQAVIHWLAHFATLRQTKVSLVVSTTGDTGPAAVQAIRDVDNPLMGILVHYPDGQISEFQRKQITTLPSQNIKVAAFQGGGDDMDLPIKRIMASSDDASETKRIVCGVNSYNIGRPLMQMVHYVWTYLRVVEDLGVEPGDPEVKVDIVLPTGAMGNIVGGYMAKLIGVPLGYLCSGVNINDMTHRVIESGQFHKSDAMLRTLSEAINIQVPYNFERLLFYITKGNHDLIRQLYSTLEATTKMDLPKDVHDGLKAEFKSAVVTDEELCDTIREVLDSYDYWTDPHTGIAFAAAHQLGYIDWDECQKKASSAPVALMATASPCKFQESVTTALGKDKWKEYMDNEFPEVAKEILARQEEPPVLYEAKAGKSFEENQVEWEKKARELIEEL